jgi:hypothetical protein
MRTFFSQSITGLALTLALSACAHHDTPKSTLAGAMVGGVFIPYGPDGKPDPSFAQRAQLSADHKANGYKAGDIAALFPGKTGLAYDFFHGNQVEYYAPDGKSFLWYPGNTKIVTGDWQVRDQEICFKYESSSVNPATGKPGGDFDCEPLATAEANRLDTAEGDVFHLGSSSSVPRALPAQPRLQSLSSLR